MKNSPVNVSQIVNCFGKKKKNIAPICQHGCRPK